MADSGHARFITVAKHTVIAISEAASPSVPTAKRRRADRSGGWPADAGFLLTAHTRLTDVKRLAARLSARAWRRAGRARTGLTHFCAVAELPVVAPATKQPKILSTIRPPYSARLAIGNRRMLAGSRARRPARRKIANVHSTGIPIVALDVVRASADCGKSRFQDGNFRRNNRERSQENRKKCGPAVQMSSVCFHRPFSHSDAGLREKHVYHKQFCELSQLERASCTIFIDDAKGRRSPLKSANYGKQTAKRLQQSRF